MGLRLSLRRFAPCCELGVRLRIHMWRLVYLRICDLQLRELSMKRIKAAAAVKFYMAIKKKLMALGSRSELGPDTTTHSPTSWQW